MTWQHKLVAHYILSIRDRIKESPMDCKCCTLMECSPTCTHFAEREYLNGLLLRDLQNRTFWETLGEIPTSETDLCNLFEKLLIKEGLEPITVA